MIIHALLTRCEEIQKDTREFSPNSDPTERWQFQVVLNSQAQL